jgi:hypothetical protein
MRRAATTPRIGSRAQGEGPFRYRGTALPDCMGLFLGIFFFGLGPPVRAPLQWGCSPEFLIPIFPTLRGLFLGILDSSPASISRHCMGLFLGFFDSLLRLSGSPLHGVVPRLLLDAQGPSHLFKPSTAPAARAGTARHHDGGANRMHESNARGRHVWIRLWTSLCITLWAACSRAGGGARRNAGGYGGLDWSRRGGAVLTAFRALPYIRPASRPAGRFLYVYATVPPDLICRHRSGSRATAAE